MANFTLQKTTTVGEFNSAFFEAFGANVRVYQGRSRTEDSVTLGECGLSTEGTFECRASLTVGGFIERMQEEYGLKVKVYTCDYWVAVLDGLTLESAGKVKKQAVKSDMEDMIAYQRDETEEVEDAQAAAEKAKAEAEKARVEAEKAAAEKAKAEAEKDAATKAASAKSSKNAGALSGVFTINSKGGKIRFSQGLLQFNPAKYEFRFAKNQYDTIGKDNEKIAPNYDGWIDLFGWGTSGYMGCQPTETSENSSDYGPSSGNIAGTNYDWGVYNPITNGGNKEGLWRTPTKDEWDYLMKGRPNAAKLKVRCTVCGVEGYLILPDDFWNNRLRFPLDITADKCSINQYNAEQWAQLESLGVVFIPKSGRRSDMYCSGWACIWLSTSSWCGDYLGAIRDWVFHRVNVGHGVRLIQDVK